MLVTLVVISMSAPVLADSTRARCDIYPAGSDHVSASFACTFSQRQGNVNIDRSDGISHELQPTGEAVGNFRDQHGDTVYRQSGLGDQGLIFRFPVESVYVYWNTAAFEPATPDHPTWPFTTQDYDATTLLRCRAVDDSEFGKCPAGILRMEDKQASIVVQNQTGAQFTINFMTDSVNATNRKVDARLEGDTWIITIDDDEIYEVPLAAIEGG